MHFQCQCQKVFFYLDLFLTFQNYYSNFKAMAKSNVLELKYELGAGEGGLYFTSFFCFFFCLVILGRVGYGKGFKVLLLLDTKMLVHAAYVSAPLLKA